MAQSETVEPKVAARGWALTDLASGGYLAGEDASERLPMGSTDKIMVALVALEQAEAGQANLGEEVTVRRTPPPSRYPSTATSAS